MKILYVSTIARHIISFHLPYLEELKKNGHQVHVACNNNEYKYTIPFIDKFHEIPFERSPLKFNNINAYIKLKEIISRENYDIIHCHTPVASVLTRLMRKNTINNTKIIYTAHGFHFYKGAPLINWLLYYPLEKYLARNTDTLVTINNEDYNRGKKFNTDIIMINGVGINLNLYKKPSYEEKNKLRNTYGIKNNLKVLFYAAELNDNKNQKKLIEYMKKIVEIDSKVILLLAGEGKKRNILNEMISKYNLKENVFLMGQRNDIQNLLKISDVIVSSSKREGLPVNLIEGMATGLPAIVSDCRGNRDLIKNNTNGFIYKNEHEFVKQVLILVQDKKIYESMSLNSINMSKQYSIDRVKFMILKLYNLYYEENSMNKGIL